MNLAQREWHDTHVARVLDLLESQRPREGETDLRNFEWFYFNRLCHSDVRTLRGHTLPVTAVAFSPDGRHIASAKPLTRSAPAGRAAPSRTSARRHGGCLHLRPFACFLKALRFFHRGVKVVVQLGLACGPVTHDPADTAGQHGDRGEQGNARGKPERASE